MLSASTIPDDEKWIPRRYVYYLMTGPETVKIGATKCLPQRLTQLRTDSQYVVAIERGDMQLERRRHIDFASDRIGRREDFRISDRLKAHIEKLMPDRDTIIKEAITPPFGEWMR